MVNVYEGKLTPGKERYGVVIGRFNEFIGSKLLDGCLDTLYRHGVAENSVDIVWVPGAFEIPIIADKIAESGKYAAVITLGAVIRGNTPHFQYVSSELAKGISQVALKTGVPVIFGVLTTDNIEQAIERAGTKSGNKGSEAAKSAIEMVSLLQSIQNNESRSVSRT